MRRGRGQAVLQVPRSVLLQQGVPGGGLGQAQEALSPPGHQGDGGQGQGAGGNQGLQDGGPHC